MDAESRMWDRDKRGGLYFSSHIGSEMTTALNVSLVPLTDDRAKLFSGIRIGLLGLTMEVLSDTTNANPGPWTEISRRPTELIFERKRREHVEVRREAAIADTNIDDGVSLRCTVRSL
jgi:hypothetical protein